MNTAEKLGVKREPTFGERMRALRDIAAGKPVKKIPPSAYRLLQYRLCLIAARTVRIAARSWPDGRYPHVANYAMRPPWRAVWADWMNKAAFHRRMALRRTVDGLHPPGRL